MVPSTKKTSATKRKGQEDSQVFMWAFIVIIILAAAVYGSSSLGIFKALNQVISAMGLDKTSAKCPFYPAAGAIAPWQCITVFGIIPFIIIYYFTYDAVSLTFLSTRTKEMIALGVAMIANLPIFDLKGAVEGFSETQKGPMIASISHLLMQFTGQLFLPYGAGGEYVGFFVVILTLGLISGLMGQIAMTSQMTGAAVLSLQETFWGFRAMNQIGSAMVKDGKK